MHGENVTSYPKIASKYGTSVNNGRIETAGASGFCLRPGMRGFMNKNASNRRKSAIKPFVLIERLSRTFLQEGLNLYLTPQAKPAESFKR
jgi:hypothetical protein